MHVYFLLGKEEFLMDEFIYKAPYEEEGKRILEVNILPETCLLYTSDAADE